MVSKNPEYVKVEGPLVFRKEILETAVDSATTLRFFEKYGTIRSKKSLQIKKLKIIMGKIVKEINAFEKIIPETDIDFKNDEKKELPKKGIKKIKKTKRESKLEDQIKEIKEKLSKLGV
jgi:hypothetical protein